MLDPFVVHVAQATVFEPHPKFLFFRCFVRRSTDSCLSDQLVIGSSVMSVQPTWPECGQKKTGGILPKSCKNLILLEKNRERIDAHRFRAGDNLLGDAQITAG